MKMTLRQFIRRLGGMALFVLGVVSLVLPVLPGFVFVGLGLYILSIDSPKIRERTKELRYRYKSFDVVMIHVERRIISRLERRSPVDLTQTEGG